MELFYKCDPDPSQVTLCTIKPWAADRRKAFDTNAYKLTEVMPLQSTYPIGYFQCPWSPTSMNTRASVATLS